MHSLEDIETDYALKLRLDHLQKKIDNIEFSIEKVFLELRDLNSQLLYDLEQLNDEEDL